eukprot:9025813-Alexandrium_andersonii.AAC.1
MWPVVRTVHLEDAAYPAGPPCTVGAQSSNGTGAEKSRGENRTSNQRSTEPGTTSAANARGNCRRPMSVHLLAVALASEASRVRGVIRNAAPEPLAGRIANR